MFGELEREDGKKAYHVSEVRTLWQEKISVQNIYGSSRVQVVTGEESLDRLRSITEPSVSVYDPSS
jgi:hypothetical protein